MKPSKRSFSSSKQLNHRMWTTLWHVPGRLFYPTPGYWALTVFHLIWAFCFLLLIYKTLIYFRDRINIAIAVLALSSIFCFQAMDLMRIYMAMAIVFYSMRYYYDDRKLKTIFYIFIAFLFHRSAICMILPVTFSSLFRSKSKVWLKVTVGVIAFLALYLLRGYLFSGTFLQYQYVAGTNTNIGIATFIYHIPLLAICIMDIKKQLIINQKNQVESVADLDCVIKLKHDQYHLIMIICSFVLGLLSYLVPVMGRMFVYFSPIYILFPASIAKENIILISNHRVLLKANRESLTKIILVALILFRAFMMTEYFYTDQVMPYTGWLF